MLLVMTGGNDLHGILLYRRTIVYTNYVRIVTGSNRLVNQNGLGSLILYSFKCTLLNGLDGRRGCGA